MAPPFDTTVTLHGPPRQPKQMLAEQTYEGHASVHDSDTADRLGLAGAPIEGPTHFSQFDPLAHALWGDEWFERGCLSAHFKTMVVEGETVTARLATEGGPVASIVASKEDGTSVLTGTASVGDRSPRPVTVSVDMDTPNGDLYPFSLADKLAGITEPSSYYATGDNPWGRPILPFEMISVLAQKAGGGFAVRGPALGLFLDLEIRLLDGPLFVGDDYVLEREVVGLGQSRRTESYWVRTTVTEASSGNAAAEVLLHSGVFKESYAGYPSST